MLQPQRSPAALPFVQIKAAWNFKVTQSSSRGTIRTCSNKTLSSVRASRQIPCYAKWAWIRSDYFSFSRPSLHGLLPAARGYIIHSIRCLSESTQYSVSNLRTYRSFTSQASDPRAKVWNRQDVHIPIGGSGNVTIEVFSLVRAVNIKSEGESNTAPESASRNQHFESQLSPSKPRHVLLIYLPPGPPPSGVTSDFDSDFEELLSGLPQIMNVDTLRRIDLQIAKINYRLEKGPRREDQEQDLRFPIPVHDVTMCFEAISKYKQFSALVNKNAPTSSLAELDRRPEVYVIGSHIGGGLALTLALTNPLNIDAVAAIDPVVDWVRLDEIAEMTTSDENIDTQDNSDQHNRQGSLSRRRLSKTLKSESIRIQRQAAQAMIDLRTSLFRTPSGFFDQFASPILFVRAPGKDTPLWRSARPESKELVNADSSETFGPYDDDWHAVHHDHVDRVLYTEQEKFDQPSLGMNANTKTEGNTDSSTPQVVSINRPSLEEVAQSLFVSPETDTETDTLKPVRRIKNLRRWPSVRLPEEVILPHVRIFSKEPPPITTEDRLDKLDLTYLLHPQAKEMVDVMRRACFWGREKSLAEVRVNLEIYGSEKQLVEGVMKEVDVNAEANCRMDRVCDWLIKLMNKTLEKQ